MLGALVDADVTRRELSDLRSTCDETRSTATEELFSSR
jgi:hypothetical protein